MYQLQNTLLPEMDNILKMMDICAQLDWYVDICIICTMVSVLKFCLYSAEAVVIKPDTRNIGEYPRPTRIVYPCC